MVVIVAMSATNTEHASQLSVRLMKSAHPAVSVKMEYASLAAATKTLALITDAAILMEGALSGVHRISIVQIKRATSFV